MATTQKPDEDELVALRNCSDLAAASRIRTRLEASGVVCFVRAEAQGAALVLVSRSDLALASSALQTSEPPLLVDDDRDEDDSDEGYKTAASARRRRIGLVLFFIFTAPLWFWLVQVALRLNP